MELFLTYWPPRIPFSYFLNQYVALLNWKNFQDGQRFRTIFLPGALQFKILQQPLTNLLFCSKVGIIRNELLFFVDFINVLTLTNHS